MIFKKWKQKTLLEKCPIQVRIVYPHAKKALRETHNEHYNASFEGAIVTAFGKVKKRYPANEDRDILMAIAIAELIDGC